MLFGPAILASLRPFTAYMFLSDGWLREKLLAYRASVDGDPADGFSMSSG